MHLAAATAKPPLQATKRGTRSKEEQAKKNVLLAKSSGHERGAPAQRINEEAEHNFDTRVVKMQDSILGIYIE